MVLREFHWLNFDFVGHLKMVVCWFDVDEWNC